MKHIFNNFRQKSAEKVEKHSHFVSLGLLGLAIAYNIFLPVKTASGPTPYTDIFNPSEESEVTEKVAEKLSLPEIELFEDRVLRTYQSTITVYNSVPWQTDGDPFTTASGTRVHDGTVAANCLPFGTRLRLPEISGDKVYVVEDRLAPRKSCYIIDIWQDYTDPNRVSIGAPITTIEILDMSPRQSFAWIQ